MREQLAFPSREPESTYDAEHPGMTLRDYFAGQALDGLIAENAPPESNGSWESVNAIAASAYQFADAMITARTASHE